uniref:retinol dehydrogenase 12 n=1 Tax=Pristiophorus japonicus TaxID=55135 RepID=UPI00398F5386
MYTLVVVVLSLLSFLLIKYCRRCRYCLETKRLDGKTVLITGGNSGIGKETSIDLARRGARVIIGCRNAMRAEAAVKDIQQASRSMNVHFRKLDLSSLRSIREFCRDFLEKEKRLDILINNAGISSCSTVTEDGFATCFGVNHLGPFLLTTLLLVRLKESAPSRVINVSSDVYRMATMDFTRFRTASRPFASYSSSKLANILFTRELSRRLEGTGVAAFSLHPGYVSTNLLSNQPFLIRMVMCPIVCLFFISNEAGAQTSVHCAVSDQVLQHNGGFFSNCRPAQLWCHAADTGVAKKLWETSEQLVGQKA